MVPLRPTDSQKLQCCVSDASAKGFTIVTKHPDLSTERCDGLWDESFAEGGSNLWETQNFGSNLLHKVKAKIIMIAQYGHALTTRYGQLYGTNECQP